MLLNDTKQEIINILNSSNLPIDAIYYVVREVLQEVEVTYNKVLAEERDARLQAAAKDNAEAKKAMEETSEIQEIKAEEEE